MSRDRDPQVRAGALLRLARVMRKTGNHAAARDAYRELARLGATRTDNLPAELVGLDGQRAVAQALGDIEGARAIGTTLLQGLHGGRWLITRGPAEFYRDGLTTAAVPDDWQLARAMADVWQRTEGRLPARGQLVVATDKRSVLVIWRSAGNRTALLTAWSDQFFRTASTETVRWQLADADGRILSGDVRHTASSVRTHSG